MTGVDLSPSPVVLGHILLTGATGRVGARFMPHLKRLGARLRLLVWTPGPAAPGRSDTMVLGDLTDAEVCRRAAAGVDAVIHIASAFQGLTVSQATEINHDATERLAAAALAAGARRFIQLSSYLVYPAGGDRPVREDDPVLTDPNASFPAAKLGAEAALVPYRDSELGVCVLRVAFTYGEGDPHLADAFTWAAGCAPDERLHLVHHADVRQGILAALRRDDAVGRTVNLADDAPATAEQLCAIAPEFTAVGAGDPPGGGGPLGCVVDTTRARELLDFRPRYPSIEDARRVGQM